MTEENKMDAFSYDVVGQWNGLYYKDLLTRRHVAEETFLLDANKDKQFFYPLMHKNKTYALSSDKLNKLPLRVKETVKIGHRSSVYHWIKRYSSAIIKAEKTMTAKQLVTRFAPFEHAHSNPRHWFLNKLITLTLLNEKGFVRLATEAGFGKTSLFQVLNPLTNDATSVNPRSAAALEYRLIYTLINLDELTNVKGSARDIMQDALLKICDWTPNYQKGTRGSAKLQSQDEYDIKDTSIVITFNDTDSYKDSNQLDNYFDKVFQRAVLTRLLPLKFTGTLDANKFNDIRNPKAKAKEYYDYLIEIVKNIKYLKNNIHKELHNYPMRKVYKFDGTGRQSKTFNKIVLYADAVSETVEEFHGICDDIYDCYKAYNTMVDTSFSYQSNEVREVKNNNEMTMVIKK